MSRGKGSEAPTSRLDQIMKRAGDMMPKSTDFRPASPGVSGFNSTGSHTLDYFIGQSSTRLGFPAGRVVELYGPNSGGKTGLMLEAMAAAARAGGIGILLTCEQVDENYAVHCCGVDIEDPEKFLLFEVYNLEGMWGLLESIVLQFWQEDFPVVLGVDSISGLGTKDMGLETKDTTDNISAASGAKFLHQAFRRGILYYLSPSRITVILVRHQTASPRAFAGATTTHGSSIDFWAYLRLQVWRSAMDKEGGERVGYWRNIKCVKSKVGIDSWTHSMPMYFGTGVDYGKEVIHFLKTHKVLKKAGAYISVGGENKYERDWVGLYNESEEWKSYFDGLAANKLGELF